MLKELRERAARAASQAVAVREEMNKQGITDPAKWPADQTEKFNSFVSDAKTAQIEVQRLEAIEQTNSELDNLNAFYSKPVSNVRPVVQSDTQERKAVSEAFGMHARFGRQGVVNFALAHGLDSDKLTKECGDIHREAFHSFLTGDVRGFRQYAETQKRVAPAEIHALLSNDNTLGGFLVPDDFQSEVIRAEAGFAAIRPLCRVQATSRDTLVWPTVVPHTSDSRYTSGFAGSWANQQANVTTSPPTQQQQPTFAEERIAVHRWQPAAVSISPELMEDSVTNVEQLLAQLIAEVKSIDEDDEFLNGTGVSRPEGILQAGCTTVNTKSATALTYVGLIDLYVNLPIQYRRNASLMMSSMTWGELLKLSTGTGGIYVFPPNTSPMQFQGRPIVFHEGMTSPAVSGGSGSPVFTAADKIMLFGDFKRYIIAERSALRIQRLGEVYAPNVGFLPMSRIGGQLTLTAAFRVANVGA